MYGGGGRPGLWHAKLACCLAAELRFGVSGSMLDRHSKSNRRPRASRNLPPRAQRPIDHDRDARGKVRSGPRKDKGGGARRESPADQGVGLTMTVAVTSTPAVTRRPLLVWGGSSRLWESVPAAMITLFTPLTSTALALGCSRLPPSTRRPFSGFGVDPKIKTGRAESKAPISCRRMLLAMATPAA